MPTYQFVRAHAAWIIALSLMIGLFGLVIVAIAYEENSLVHRPCAEYSTERVRDVPARCLPGWGAK